MNKGMSIQGIVKSMIVMEEPCSGWEAKRGAVNVQSTLNK